MKQTRDERLVDALRQAMRLPWRVRWAEKPGIQDRLELPLLVTGAIRTARAESHQAAMVSYAVLAANALPRLLAHCQALERQLARAGLDLGGDPGLADEILAALEAAGFTDAEA